MFVLTYDWPYAFHVATINPVGLGYFSVATALSACVARAATTPHLNICKYVECEIRVFMKRIV
jgi:hypothetical protein